MTKLVNPARGAGAGACGWTAEISNLAGQFGGRSPQDWAIRPGRLRPGIFLQVQEERRIAEIR